MEMFYKIEKMLVRRFVDAQYDLAKAHGMPAKVVADYADAKTAAEDVWLRLNGQASLRLTADQDVLAGLADIHNSTEHEYVVLVFEKDKHNG